MATPVGDIAVRVGADTSGLTRGLNEASGKLGDFEKSAAATGKAVGALAAAAIAAGAAISTALAVKGFQAVDALDEMAEKAGTTVSSLQSLQLALGEAGVNSDQTQAAIKKLNLAIGEAQSGNVKAQSTFNKLGLSVAELAALPADQRFAAIADSVSKYGNAADQAVISSEIFGAKLGPDLAAAMAQGGDAIRQASSDIEAMGLAMSDIDAAQVANAMDAFGRAQGVVDAVSNKLAVELAPLLDAVSKSFIQAGKDGGGFGEIVASAVSAAIKAVAFLANAVDGVKRIGGAVADSLVYAFAMVQETFTKVALGIVKTLDMIPGVDLTANIVALEAKVVQAQGVMREAAAEIRDGFEKPLAGDVFLQYAEQAKAASKEAAAATVAARESVRGGETAGVDNSAADQKAAEALAKKQSAWDAELEAYVAAESEKAGAKEAIDRERAAAEIARIQEQYATEDQLLADKLAREEAAIAAARELGAITQEQHDAMMLDAMVANEAAKSEIEQRGADQRAAIAAAEQQARMASTKSLLGQLSTMMNSESRKMFEAGKAAALASGTISAVESIIDAYKFGTKIGGPVLGATFGAAAAVAQFNQLNNIRKQQFNGGGSASAGGGTSATGAINANNTQAVSGGNTPTQRTNVTLIGDSFGREAVIGMLHEAFKDGFTLSTA